MMRSMLSLLTSLALLAPGALAADAPAKKVEEKKAEEKKDDKKAAEKKVVDTKKPEEKKPEPAAAEKKDAAPAATIVEIKTSEGSIKLALDEKAAPVTVKNFLAYVNDKFYDGTIFHRVIDGFMIQGGGYAVEGDKLNEKATKPPIVNEGKNGLKNDEGTIAMARTPDPNSASAQWFINLVNNDSLNYPSPDGHGYAVFGKVTEGMDIVKKIGKVKTGNRYGMQNVPETEVKIISITVVKAAS